MKNISLLKRLVHRRQLLLSGLALAILSTRATLAHEEQVDLKVSSGGNNRKPFPMMRHRVIKPDW